MQYSNIEEIIRDHIHFKHGPNSKGWNSVYCEVCGDGHRTKGPRGGWLFTDNSVFYNCFNCGIDGNFDPQREFPFSRNMYSILKSFNIPLKYCYQLISDNNTFEKKVVPPVKMTFETFDIPDHLYLLSDASPNNVIAQKALDHLINKRRIDPSSYPFMLSTGHTESNNPKDVNIAQSLKDRLIIPSFMGDKIIGFEGMALGGQAKKYIAIGTNLIHGYNNIYSNDESVPLFVTEGFFDAFHVNGVAVMTNKLTQKQIELLERTNRPKVVIPDRKNTHNMLAEKAIELGWGLSLPNIRPYKDVSEAIEHYGILHVVRMVMENIRYGNIAKISLNLYNMT